MSSPSTRSVSMQSRPSAVSVRTRSSSGGGGSSPGQTSTSCSAFSRSSAANGRFYVTKTRGTGSAVCMEKDPTRSDEPPQDGEESIEEYDREMEEDPSVAHPNEPDDDEYDRLRGG